LLNFANIAQTGTPLYCIIEKYSVLPDYIDALPNKGVEEGKKKKTIKDYLNDIIYSKLV